MAVFFDYFLSTSYLPDAFCFTIESFVKKIKPDKSALLHYSGAEDEKFYNQPILNMQKLTEWCKEALKHLV